MSAAAEAEARENRRTKRATAHPHNSDDIEERAASPSLSSESDSLDKQLSHSKAYGTIGQKSGKVAVVQGLNRPLFHVDITAALNSALANAQRKSH